MALQTVQAWRLETCREQDKNTYDVDGKYKCVQRPEIECGALDVNQSHCRGAHTGWIQKTIWFGRR